MRRDAERCVTDKKQMKEILFLIDILKRSR